MLRAISVIVNALIAKIQTKDLHLTRCQASSKPILLSGTKIVPGKILNKLEQWKIWFSLNANV